MDMDLQRQTVLVVDDTPENIDVLSAVLAPEYRVKAALNFPRAWHIAIRDPKPDIILLDVMMPGIDGYEACRQLKADPRTAAIPVIFITAKDQDDDECRGLQLGAVDYITKPVIPSIVLARIRTHLSLYDQNRVLEEKVRMRTEELRQTRLEIIRRLGRAVEFKDNETGLHVLRMSHYARLLACAAGAHANWQDLILHAAPMHDIGKIGVPDKVLQKTGKLDEHEWQLMRKHPLFGASIIGDEGPELLTMSHDIALTHHEKWDGSGYPTGLTGEAIPLAGRIVAIADVFDALTTHRPYKAAWPIKETMQYIQDNAGSHFDPGLMPAFRQAMPDMLRIFQRYADPSATLH